jgi:hypothetical protein
MRRFRNRGGTMSPAGFLIAGVGMAASFLGWLAAMQVFPRIATAPLGHRGDLNAGARFRALCVGGILSIALAVGMSLGAATSHLAWPLLWTLALGFVLPACYSLGWLVLVTRIGQQDVLAGEFGLVIAGILMASLWVMGFLWITLAVLGTGVILTSSLAASLYINRCA